MIPTRAQSLAASRRRQPSFPNLFPSREPAPAPTRASVPAPARATGAGGTAGRISPPQVRLVCIARNAARVGEERLSDGQYRTILRTAAGVESSKDLDNRGFEKVMAILEELGFVDKIHGVGYWGRASGRRLIHYVKQLAEPSRYNLAALVLKFSGGRTDNPDELLPQEAWKLVEMLKASNAREDAHANQEAAAERPVVAPSPVVHGMPRSGPPDQPAHKVRPAPAAGRSSDVPGVRPSDGDRARQHTAQPHAGRGDVDGDPSRMAAPQTAAGGTVPSKGDVGLSEFDDPNYCPF